MVCRFASGLAATLFLLASGTNVAAQGPYSEDRNYTVKDLIWCLNARPPPIQTCGFYVSVVADVVRFSDVRYMGKRICWPKSEPMKRQRVFSMVMKRERLGKWDPSAPAVVFIISALAEVYPCKK